MISKQVAFIILTGLTVGFSSTVSAQPPAPEGKLLPEPMLLGDLVASEAASGPMFRDTQFGDYPNYGQPGAPGEGYPHQELRGVHYGLWYRPNSYRGSIDWYKPKRFNPRGFGAPQHNAYYKLDYAPAVVHFPETQYGPQYYPRFRSYDVPKDDDLGRSPWWCWWRKNETTDR